MSKNLTLTIDEELLRSARKLALDRNTSVNSMVRDYLVKLVAEAGTRQAARADLAQLFQEKPYIMGENTWTRSELHER